MFKAGPLKWVIGGVLLLIVLVGVIVVVSDLPAVREVEARMEPLQKRILASEELLADCEKLPARQAAKRLNAMRAECMQVDQEVADACDSLNAVRFQVLIKDQIRVWTGLAQRQSEIHRRLEHQYNAAVQQLVKEGVAEP